LGQSAGDLFVVNIKRSYLVNVVLKYKEPTDYNFFQKIAKDIGISMIKPKESISFFVQNLMIVRVSHYTKNVSNGSPTDAVTKPLTRFKCLLLKYLQ
jgi:hypothetical protein